MMADIIAERVVLRFAVCGAGSIGREFALRHLNEELGVEVVAVVDKNLQLAELLAKDVSLKRAGAVVQGSKYREYVDHSTILSDIGPKVLCSSSLEDILADVDCVYIGTPPSTHASLTMLALSAKKHVLLEKPLAVTSQDCEAIVSGAGLAWADFKIGVNVNIGMRYNAALHALKDQILSKSIGDIKCVTLRLQFLQWPRQWQVQPWVAERREGGPLLEVGTHWIFAILELFSHSGVVQSYCDTVFPDDGVGCETSCKGFLVINGLHIRIDVEAVSDVALATGKDIYELEIEGTGGSLIFYDFTKLRDGMTGEDIAVGEYGRKACVSELVRLIHSGDASAANIVTPKQAHNVQKIIECMKSSTSASPVSCLLSP